MNQHTLNTAPRRAPSGRLSLCTLALSTLAIAVVLALPGLANAQVQRFALVVGANDGGDGRVTLRYAEDDARRVTEIMQDVGGVAEADTILLTDPTIAELDDAFEGLGTAVENASSAERIEVFFYYSGHSDEQGLLLHGDMLSYRALRDAMDALSSDVRIIVLDSCAAGALTRTKGGARRAPFLIDEASEVSGHAFLTSSSADEVAQESDRIGGSFFTHYLVTGLRGAADTTEDGMVTLNEAYQFAFHETLARTESTRSGPQHAVYEIQLTGTGDLVLTDIRDRDSQLLFGDELEGRVYVHDTRNGRLVAELSKVGGRQVGLRLPTGEYTVVIHDGQRARGALATLSGGTFTIETENLTEVELEETVARGPVIVDIAPETGPERGTGTDVPRETPAPVESPEVVNRDESIDPIEDAESPGDIDEDAVTTYRTVPFHIGLVPGIGMNDMAGEGPIENQVALHVLVGGNDRVDGFSAAGLVSWADEIDGFAVAGLGTVAGEVHGAQASGIFNQVSSLDGAQIAGIYNGAGEVDGAQLALVNVGGSVDGAQIGLINIADNVDGAQIGLVNIASESGAPIGLFNLAGDGILSPTVWTSETSIANAGIKMGGRHFYTQLSVGATWMSVLEGETEVGTTSPKDPVILPVEETQTTEFIGEMGFALGGRIPVTGDGRISLDLDLQHTHFFTDRGPRPETLLERLRLGVNIHLADWFTVYGGASFNTMIELLRESVTVTNGPVALKVVHERTATDDVRVSIFPGFFAGVAF